MDSNEVFSASKSPRSRELQGPRPPPLRVSKDSHKIRKPPVPPRTGHSQPQTVPPRQPVIIYAVSPKVIHTNPTEFMSLVQRLTGPSPKHSNAASSSSAPRVDNYNPYFNSNEVVSPAARYASLERAAKSPEGKRTGGINVGDDMAGLEGIEMGRVLERTGLIPGILSPGPASLQPIPATFFSPPHSGDPNPLSFFHDHLSPAFLYNHKSMNFSEMNSLLQSPTPFVSPRITSPAPSMDLFNHFFDF